MAPLSSFSPSIWRAWRFLPWSPCLHLKLYGAPLVLFSVNLAPLTFSFLEPLLALEMGAMQFQVHAGAPGKKTSGAPNRPRKGREGRHAVSSASRGSREENVRGAKLTEKGTRRAPWSFKWKQGLQGKHQGRQITEKRTRDAPCSFKCKQGLQGRKRQGRQIDGEKNERGAIQFHVKQGLQGRKRQGRQIDGEKDERGAM